MVRLRRLGKLAPRYHSGWPGARSLRPEWYHGHAIVERLVVTWCCFQRPQALLSTQFPKSPQGRVAFAPACLCVCSTCVTALLKTCWDSANFGAQDPAENTHSTLKIAGCYAGTSQQKYNWEWE